MMQRMTQWFFGLRIFARQKKKVEITVETSETWGIKWFRQSKSEICTQCGAETIFVSPDLGVQIVGPEPAVIYGLIDSGRVHSNGKQGHERLICLSSLRQSLEAGSPQERSKENL
jgi:hypothetical protein